jgi:hypothetical protein
VLTASIITTLEAASISETLGDIYQTTPSNIAEDGLPSRQNTRVVAGSLTSHIGYSIVSSLQFPLCLCLYNSQFDILLCKRWMQWRPDGYAASWTIWSGDGCNLVKKPNLSERTEIKLRKIAIRRTSWAKSRNMKGMRNGRVMNLIKNSFQFLLSPFPF